MMYGAVCADTVVRFLSSLAQDFIEELREAKATHGPLRHS